MGAQFETAAAGLPAPPKFHAQAESDVDVLLNTEPVPKQTCGTVKTAVGTGFTTALVVAVATHPVTLKAPAPPSYGQLSL